ncbi:MAG: hypothetical protein NTZ79_08270 [Proteobacteria bacterium]|nr:hypothetical protein [Pseudomonadota bacterium]
MKTFLWLVRRELWESRIIWMAPAICALIVIGCALLVALNVGTLQLDGFDFEQFRSDQGAQKLGEMTSHGLALLSVPFFMIVLVTQYFYAADSLYSERRDRSILFWKSLPISDTATVLSKLAVVAVVMPAAAAACALVSQLAVFAIVSIRFASSAGIVVHLWQPAVWGGWLALLTYLMLASALWHLPKHAWLLLVSAWAPRSAAMFALLPPCGIMLAEFIVLRTHAVWSLIGDRFGYMGVLVHALGDRVENGFSIVIDGKSVLMPHSVASMMRPLDFIASPAVWIGVAFAAVAVGAAIWMRRYRDSTI